MISVYNIPVLPNSFQITSMNTEKECYNIRWNTECLINALKINFLTVWIFMLSPFNARPTERIQNENQIG
jgi:hypothetical protein